MKYDPERVDTFNAYVMKGMKWAISDEIHMKGTPFKISRRVSHEERNKMNIHSIDLHREEETVNEFYAVSTINVEEVMLSIGIQEVTSVLEEEEKTIIMHVRCDFTEQEIYVKLEVEKSTVHTRKTRAFLKMNPNYKLMKQKSFFLGKRRMVKRNHQLGLVI